MSGVDIWAPIAAQVELAIPETHRKAIAIVGAGGIVDVAHLVAYNAIGLDIVGIYDPDTVKAADVAARHGVRRVYQSLDELLDDDRVEVVDIAVPGEVQPDVVRQVAPTGRHMLCQKPFAPSVEVANELIALADDHGVRIAVNQQMRYDEGIAAARAMVNEGWIGEAHHIAFNTDIHTDWDVWPHIAGGKRIEIAYHSIHYLDSIRSILGNPARVFCIGSRRPGQTAVGETRTASTLIYPDGVHAVIQANHENIGGDPRAEFRIDGSHGSIRGTLGLLYDFPHGRPDTLELFSTILPTDGWLAYPVTKRWIPDAFIGPMADLLRWVATGETAPTAGQDNVHTLALVDALYASMESGKAEEPLV